MIVETNKERFLKKVETFFLNADKYASSGTGVSPYAPYDTEGQYGPIDSTLDLGVLAYLDKLERENKGKGRA